MHDDARLRPVGLDADRARDDGVGREALAQQRDVVEAVEQRQHELGLCRDPLERRAQPRGLGGDDQCVRRLRQALEHARAGHELPQGHAVDAQPVL